MTIMPIENPFDLTGKVAIITGGGGLLGRQHALAIAQFGGVPVVWDINATAARETAVAVWNSVGHRSSFGVVDVTDTGQIKGGFESVLSVYGRADILINNVCANPHFGKETLYTRFENYPRETWTGDLELGLTSAFLCSQIIGTHMAENGGGVIVNIASDLSVIAPDNRLYRRDDLPDAQQPVKPVGYSVVKHGIIGLTKYLAAYWAGKVRVNALSPGGVYNGQPEDFVWKLSELIPMGRMATVTEMQGAIVFLCSRASSYMTGHNLIVDGGRTIL